MCSRKRPGKVQSTEMTGWEKTLTSKIHCSLQAEVSIECQDGVGMANKRTLPDSVY